MVHSKEEWDHYTVDLWESGCSLDQRADSGPDGQYLHTDGQWRESMYNSDHEVWTGYFDTKQQLEQVLNKARFAD